LACHEISEVPNHFSNKAGIPSELIESYEMLFHVLHLKFFSENKLGTLSKNRIKRYFTKRREYYNDLIKYPVKSSDRICPVFSYKQRSVKFVQPILNILENRLRNDFRMTCVRVPSVVSVDSDDVNVLGLNVNSNTI